MKNYQDYKVLDNEAGIRLDRFVANKNIELSRSFAQKLILDGSVKVNSNKTKSSYTIQSGDVVRVENPVLSQDADLLQAENIPLNIVFEDDEIIVVNKPAGMVIHPAAGVSSGTLVNAVLAHIGLDLSGSDEFNKNQNINPDYLNLINITPKRPGIVHRIDKGTSGLVIVAKTTRAYYDLSGQFKEHSIQRKYVTLVCGNLKQDRGIIVAPIGRSRRDRKKMAVMPAHSKEAITRFAVAERYNDFSLLDIWPRTGRTHQIRVHLMHLGHPVVGDLSYGGCKRALKLATSYPAEVENSIQNLSRQALHAQLLGFIHPVTAEYMEFSAPPPEDIQDIIDALRAMHDMTEDI